MNCEEARLLVGADPEALTAELGAHLAGCTACTTFQQEMLIMERDVRRALQLPLNASARTAALSRPTLVRGATSGAPPAAAAPASPPSQRVSPRRWALAAGVLAAVVGAALLWSSLPSTSLAADVVSHVQHEPESLTRTQTVPEGDVEKLLQSAGVTVSGTHKFSYAQNCFFHGHFVPHLVFQTDHGPYTLMILPGEKVAARQHFSESGYSGVLLPRAHGALAVLGADSELDQVADQIDHTVQW